MSEESNTREVTCRNYDELNDCLSRLRMEGWQRDGTIWWHGDGTAHFRCRRIDTQDKPTKRIYAN